MNFLESLLSSLSCLVTLDAIRKPLALLLTQCVINSTFTKIQKKDLRIYFKSLLSSLSDLMTLKVIKNQLAPLLKR